MFVVLNQENLFSAFVCSKSAGSLFVCVFAFVVQYHLRVLFAFVFLDQLLFVFVFLDQPSQIFCVCICYSDSTGSLVFAIAVVDQLGHLCLRLLL